MDGRGELLLTGDEDGIICARLLHRGRRHDSPVNPASVALEDDSENVEVLVGAHEGGVFAVCHVEESLQEFDAEENTKFFVSGGVGEWEAL